MGWMSGPSRAPRPPNPVAGEEPLFGRGCVGSAWRDVKELCLAVSVCEEPGVW